MFSLGFLAPQLQEVLAPPRKPDANTSIKTPAPTGPTNPISWNGRMAGRRELRHRQGTAASGAAVPARYSGAEGLVGKPAAGRCGSTSDPESLDACGATVTLLGIDRLMNPGAFGVDSVGPENPGVVGPDQPSEIKGARSVAGGRTPGGARKPRRPPRPASDHPRPRRRPHLRRCRTFADPTADTPPSLHHRQRSGRRGTGSDPAA